MTPRVLPRPVVQVPTCRVTDEVTGPPLFTFRETVVGLLWLAVFLGLLLAVLRAPDPWNELAYLGCTTWILAGGYRLTRRPS